MGVVAEGRSALKRRAALLALLVVLPVLAGCTRGGPDDPEGPAPGSSLVIGTALPIGTLDPADARGAARLLVLPQVLEGLTRLDPGTGRPAPALARAWSVDEAGRNYSFELRENVRFHDGTLLDAAAAKASLDRARGPIAGRAGDASAPLARVADVRVESPTRLVVEARESDPTIPAALALPAAAIVSPAAYTPVEFRTGHRGDPPVGTGPFRVTAVSEREVRLRAVAEHWDGGARVENLTVRSFASAIDLAAALRAGLVHGAWGGLDPDVVRALALDEALAVDRAMAPASRVLVLDATEPPLADAHVRRALAYAVDRDAIVLEAFAGNASGLFSLAPAGVPLGGTTEFRDRYGGAPDVVRALSELALAGYRPEAPLHLELAFSPALGPDEDEAARVLARTLEATGAVVVSVQSHEGRAFESGATLGLFRAFLWRAAPDVPDAHAYHASYYASAGTARLGAYYASEDMDALVAAAARAAEDEREEAAARVKTLGAEDAPVLPLWQESEPFARVANLTGGVALADGALRLTAARVR